MRYYQGQRVVFVELFFLPGKDEQCVKPRTSQYNPELDRLLSVRLCVLTCKEHHKVRKLGDSPWTDATHDAFVFVDDEGRRWCNQFPCAQYNHLENHADYSVRPMDLEDKRFADEDTYMTDITFYMSDAFTSARRLLERAAVATTTKERDTLEAAAEGLWRFNRQLRGMLEEAFRITAVERLNMIKTMNPGHDPELYPQTPFVVLKPRLPATQHA